MRKEFNFKISLTQEQRHHMAQLLRGSDPQEELTEPELAKFYGDCMRCALSLDVDTSDAADTVIQAVNRGYAMIGQDPTPEKA